jgi:hypothetical protein
VYSNPEVIEKFKKADTTTYKGAINKIIDATFIKTAREIKNAEKEEEEKEGKRRKKD